VAIDIALHLVKRYVILSLDLDLTFDSELTSLKFMQPGLMNYPCRKHT